MTEEEARKALFDLHFEYMTHPPKERLKLYDEYQRKRGEIRKSLTEFVITNSEENSIMKKK